MNVVINFFSIIFIMNFFSLNFLNRIKICFIYFVFIDAIFIKRIKFDKINIFEKNRVNEFFLFSFINKKIIF